MDAWIQNNINDVVRSGAGQILLHKEISLNYNIAYLGFPQEKDVHLISLKTSRVAHPASGILEETLHTLSRQVAFASLSFTLRLFK